MFTHKHPAARRLLLIYSLIVIGCLLLAVVLMQTLNVSLLLKNKYPYKPGSPIDSLNGIVVYYNGATGNVMARSITADGYNLGLQWQCVEFVKRYYYERFNHKMPNAKGNAKDLFDNTLPDASFNEARGLVQYRNASLKQPAVDDIIVFDGRLGNKYGHVGIITEVNEGFIEIIQQNNGPHEPTRTTLELAFVDDRWQVLDKNVLGWLRIE